MQKTLMIMASEIRTTLRRKSFVIIAIVVPLLLSLLALGLGIINRSALESAMVEIAAAPSRASLAAGYVDPGNLIRTVPADLPADRLLRFDDEAAAQAAVQAEATTPFSATSRAGCAWYDSVSGLPGGVHPLALRSSRPNPSPASPASPTVRFQRSPSTHPNSS